MEIDGNTLVLVFVFLFILYSNPSGDGVTSQYEYNQLQTLKAQYQDEYSQFQNLTSDNNFRNITGLRLSYGDVLRNPDINATYPIEGKDYDHWYSDEKYTLLPEDVLHEVNNSVWQHGKNVYPANLTSTLHGRVVNSHGNYLKVPMPIPEYYEPAQDLSQNQPAFNEPYFTDPAGREAARNITFDEGEIVIEISSADTTSSFFEDEHHFHNSQSDKLRFLHMNLHFSDPAYNEKHVINTKAIYDIKNGRIMAISESAKFHSLFALPHYINLKSEDEAFFNAVKTLVEEYWNATDFVNTRSMAYLQDSYATANFKCEFLAFLQLEPWWGYSQEQLKIVDEELMWPLGRRANLSSLPPVNISSGIIYSPDCGIKLQVSNAHGLRYELQVRKMRKLLLCGALLLASQIYLLLSQMQHTNTPSMVNKISYWCFSLMNLVDGSLAIIFFVLTSSIPVLYLPLIMCSFACLILASVFEIRYLISVYASQANEQSVGIMTLLRRSTEGEERRTPTVMPDEASISTSLYRTYIVKMFFSMIVILSMTTWPQSVRMPIECIIIFLLNSYWVPQIARNAIKGNEPRRRQIFANDGPQHQRQNKMPLLWSFTIGTSVIRFVPVAYVYTVPSNVFYHHQDRLFVAVVALWLVLQMGVLYSQEIIGARWFLPNYSIPEGYSYHKGISSGELLEHGSSANYTIDCAICMTDVAVYVDDIDETHKVDKDSYMVTPCGHIFHTQCLENWMSYKLQCPVCRAPLPPL
ncbi:LANO_0D04786g1_1 [Lachancea nothofagi CBS 11611]|uniref:RING-type E3 ubiquitin transferase n=1 Tax=Lachancea nothofagi CBS 11611 TaxID=1266666 RepID=A0A1G4JGP0_9SACH|nr:LANO_0D04786g1_1 [Lachancea nothofagi CBS 11611]